MNIENLEKEFENFEIFDFEKVGNIEHHDSRAGHLRWADMQFKQTGTYIDREIILTLWNRRDEHRLLVDYTITDKTGKTINAHNKEFNLDDFVGDWTDLPDEIEVWIDTCDDEDNELRIENLYSETDAMVTAKLMNDFGLSFTTTIEDENPDLRRKPPFTADDIMQWFDEAVRIIQKRYAENIEDSSFDVTEYVNGPIYITVDKHESVRLNVNLFSRVE